MDLKTILTCLTIAVFPTLNRGATVRVDYLATDLISGSQLGLVVGVKWIHAGETNATPFALVESGGYCFVSWSSTAFLTDVIRVPWGRSLNPVSFTVFENTTVTAHYLPATHDSDTDGIPDWFELEYQQ